MKKLFTSIFVGTLLFSSIANADVMSSKIAIAKIKAMSYVGEDLKYLQEKMGEIKAQIEQDKTLLDKASNGKTDATFYFVAINTKLANLRGEPNGSSPVVKQLYEGDVLACTGVVNSYNKCFDDSKVVFVHDSLTKQLK